MTFEDNFKPCLSTSLLNLYMHAANLDCTADHPLPDIVGSLVAMKTVSSTYVLGIQSLWCRNMSNMIGLRYARVMATDCLQPARMLAHTLMGSLEKPEIWITLGDRCCSKAYTKSTGGYPDSIIAIISCGMESESKIFSKSLRILA